MTTIKDSGNREAFEGGAVRDTQDGKSRPDLICPFFLERLGHQLAAGAKKYAERNWEKGMPQPRVKASKARHTMSHDQGLEDEDHLAAEAFNLMVMISQEERVKRGLLDPKWLSPELSHVKEDDLKSGDDSGGGY